MTKLLVLSDSHGARDAIKRILNKEQNNVDAVIFLGDGLRDLEQALAFFPHLRIRWRTPPPLGAPRWRCSATPTFPTQSSGAMYFCSTPAPAGAATPARTPTVC